MEKLTVLAIMVVSSLLLTTEKQPRGFRIDHTGRFLVASGEKSDTLSMYAIDPASGALKPIGKYPTGKGSNWIEIVSFD